MHIYKSLFPKLFFTSLFSLTLLIGVNSQEIKPPASGTPTIIEEENVPKEIIDNLNERIEKQDFEVLEWRTQGQNYEVKLKGNKHYTFMVFDSNHHFIEKKVKLDWEKEAPTEVKNAKINSKFSKWEVLRFYEIFPKDKDSYYQAQLNSMINELHHIRISKSGELTVLDDTNF